MQVNNTDDAYAPYIAAVGLSVFAVLLPFHML